MQALWTKHHPYWQTSWAALQGNTLLLKTGKSPPENRTWIFRRAMVIHEDSSWHLPTSKSQRDCEVTVGELIKRMELISQAGKSPPRAFPTTIFFIRGESLPGPGAVRGSVAGFFEFPRHCMVYTQRSLQPETEPTGHAPVKLACTNVAIST